MLFLFPVMKLTPGAPTFLLRHRCELASKREKKERFSRSVPESKSEARRERNSEGMSNNESCGK